MKKNDFGVQLLRWQVKLYTPRSKGIAECKFCGEKKGNWLHFFLCERKPAKFEELQKKVDFKLNELGSKLNVIDVIKDYSCRKLIAELGVKRDVQKHNLEVGHDCDD